jgi:hypothetical protein
VNMLSLPVMLRATAIKHLIFSTGFVVHLHA